jgi:hypothetical protein
MTMKSIAILRGGVNATFIESKKPTVTGGGNPPAASLRCRIALFQTRTKFESFSASS